MEKKWWQSRQAIVAGTAIIAAFIIGFVIWFTLFRPFVSTDDARVSGDVINVANAGVSGQIMNVNVEEGDIVTNGEVLVELDHRTAQAQLEQAQARATLAAATFYRVSALQGSTGFVRQQYDQAKSDNEIAQANLDLAKLALEHSYIYSPIDGVVIAKEAISGNILEGNQVAITLIDIANAWVEANISEIDIARVKPGDKVNITVDEGFRLTGKVSEVLKSAASVFSLIPADNATGNFIKVTQRIPVKIILDPHPGKKLRVGESVEVSIKVD